MVKFEFTETCSWMEQCPPPSTEVSVSLGLVTHLKPARK